MWFWSHNVILIQSYDFDSISKSEYWVIFLVMQQKHILVFIWLYMFDVILLFILRILHNRWNTQSFPLFYGLHTFSVLTLSLHSTAHYIFISLLQHSMMIKCCFMTSPKVDRFRGTIKGTNFNPVLTSSHYTLVSHRVLVRTRARHTSTLITITGNYAHTQQTERNLG